MPREGLALLDRGSYRLATVPDPASEYASLRSVVTDVHGDGSVQTIYRGSRWRAD
jgi:hypothetical protein